MSMTPPLDDSLSVRSLRACHLAGRARPGSLAYGRHFFGSFHTVPSVRAIRYCPSGDATSSRGRVALVVDDRVRVPRIGFSAFVGSARMIGADAAVSRGVRYTVSWSADRHSAVASFGLAA